MKKFTIKEVIGKLDADEIGFRGSFRSIANDCMSYNFHDNLLLAVCKRAIDVTDTVRYATRKYNFNTLYPLMRLQIDSCLILQAALLYKDNNEFFVDLFDRDFQAREYKIPATGEFMTERRLAKLLDEEFPSFLEKYKYCCDFVHFTDLSLGLPVRNAESLSFQVSDEVGNRESKFRIRFFIDDFCEVDKILLLLIERCRSEFLPYKDLEI